MSQATELVLVLMSFGAEESEETMEKRKKVAGIAPPKIKRLKDGEIPEEKTVHVVVEPGEYEMLRDWMRQAKIADIKSAIRWLIWYAYVNGIAPEEDSP
jgi:hypothetical protein